MSAASEQDPNLLAPSHPSEAKPGRNDIVVATMHYGHQRMIFEKDVAIAVRDGTVLYANVFRPPEDGRYPVVVSFDVYGKDTIHVAAAMPAGGAYTLGQYNASPVCGLGGARSRLLGPERLRGGQGRRARHVRLQRPHLADVADGGRGLP